MSTIMIEKAGCHKKYLPVLKRDLKGQHNDRIGFHLSHHSISCMNVYCMHTVCAFSRSVQTKATQCRVVCSLARSQWYKYKFPWTYKLWYDMMLSKKNVFPGRDVGFLDRMRQARDRVLDAFIPKGDI